jgi:hypothetical protein
MTKVAMIDKMRQLASDSATPGLMEFVASKHQIKEWLEAAEKEITEKLETATDDEFEVVTASYVRGVKKAAMRHSESEWDRMRDAGVDVVELDLRFGRYLSFWVDYVDPGGKDYRLYGAPPTSTPPPDLYWGTCQDWLDAIRTTAVCDAVRIFRRLPCNEYCIQLEPGQVVTKIDTTRKSETGESLIKTIKVKREQLKLL